MFTAHVQAFREVEPAETEKGFELSLAIINAFGERGNVAAVRRHLNEYLERYSEIPCAISYGYTALIKAYRCSCSCRPLRLFVSSVSDPQQNFGKCTWTYGIFICEGG